MLLVTRNEQHKRIQRIHTYTKSMFFLNYIKLLTKQINEV